MLIEAVVADVAFEVLDEDVLGDFAWLDMLEVHIAPLSPEVDCPPGKLGITFTGDGVLCSHRVTEGIEQIRH